MRFHNSHHLCLNTGIRIYHSWTERNTSNPGNISCPAVKRMDSLFLSKRLFYQTLRHKRGIAVFIRKNRYNNLKSYSYLTTHYLAITIFVTWTRRDSDIKSYYGYLNEMNLPEPDKILETKKRLALIVVSNCDYLPGAKLRMELTKQLQEEGLALTTSGSCFPNSRQFQRNPPDALRQFTSEHKFYLAFENSYHCKDYVTEKFFRAIEAGTVPVVWGAKKEDYLKFVPENAFIFVEDFPTLEDLVKYLNYLDKNDNKYMEYFK